MFCNEYTVVNMSVELAASSRLPVDYSAGNSQLAAYFTLWMPV